MSEPTRVSPPLWTAPFILITLVNLAVFSGFQMIMPSFSRYLVDEFGAPDSTIGLVLSAFTATALVSRPFIGRLVDQFGRKLLLVGGIALFVLASLGYAWAPTIAWLVALRALHGLGLSSSTTGAATLAADVIPRSRRGEGMGYFGMAGNFAQAFGPAFGLAFAARGQFVPLFYVAAGLSLVALVLSLFLPETGDRQNGKATAHPPGGLIEGRALPAAAGMLLLAACLGGIVGYIALYAPEQGLANAGWFFTVFAVAVLVGRPVAGVLADRGHARGIILVGLSLTGAALALLGAGLGVPGVLGSAVLFGLGFGSAQPVLLAIAVDAVEPACRGAANATFFFFFDLGIGVGLLSFGWLAEAVGYGTSYLLSTLFALLAVGLVALWPQPYALGGGEQVFAE